MSTPKIYKLGGMDVYDVNGVPHSVLTRAPIGRNRTTGQPNKIYKLGGANVYDVNGIPHYASTNKPVIRDNSGKPRNVYKLGGQEVYDIDNKPYYASTGKELQLNDLGTPIESPARGRIETGGSNINGVDQRGTQMSVSAANNLLSDGYKIQNPFASTQLPSTAYSPYAGQGMSKVFDQENLQNLYGDVNDIQLAEDLFGGKSGVKSVTPTNDISAMDIYGEDANRINQLKAQGAAFLVRNGEIPTTDAVDPANSGTNWAARTAADNSDPDLARRKAFLNADNAFQGLRDVEALQGLSYASGQHYMHNPTPNKDGEYSMTAIRGKDRQDDVRDYKAGRMTANDLKDKYMTAITASKDSPINAKNIMDTLSMPENYMTEATPSQPITDYTNMIDTDIDYEAMGKRNPGGMIGGITYKR